MDEYGFINVLVKTIDITDLIFIVISINLPHLHHRYL